MSQPAVSKHLALLEAEVGRGLVTRGREGAALTPAGEVLAEFVLRAEALLANASRALAMEQAETGVLLIAASATPATYLLPELLARFRERHPAVDIRLESATSADAVELVRSHRVELAVVGALTLPAELEAEPLAGEEIVVVGPPALGGRRLRPGDLGQLPWIALAGSVTRAAVDAARRELGIERAGARTAVRRGRQAGRRRRRRDRRDQPARAGSRARVARFGGARCAALAAVANDHGGPRPRCRSRRPPSGSSASCVMRSRRPSRLRTRTCRRSGRRWSGVIARSTNCSRWSTPAGGRSR